jgi:kynurenine formamidase
MLKNKHSIDQSGSIIGLWRVDDVTDYVLSATTIEGTPLEKKLGVHRVICGADKRGLENIANLDKLPVTGATLYVISC